MTHILIPREPSTALLRPFIGCNTQELHEAWAAMVRIAEVQHARAGSQCLQQIEEGPQSVDIAINHGTEDLAMHPLSTAPAALAGPAWDKTRDSLAALLLGLARHPFLNFDVACIALDAATERGMPLAYMRAAPAAPALDAPAAPATSAQVQALHRARRALHAIGKTYDDSELRTRAIEADEEIDRMLAAAPQTPAQEAPESHTQALHAIADWPVTDMLMNMDAANMRGIAQRALAAAPQAPAAPVGLPWRTGIPPWTDDRSVRVIAVTAHDDFGGVQVHDIRASDFHTDGDGDGAEVARVCTHWAYRDDIWPRANAVAPAAPIPWDNFPAYLIDHCEGQTITEEGLQRALSAMLANPQYAGAAPAAPAVDASAQVARDAGFNHGVCLALQIMASAGNAGDAEWTELLDCAGREEIMHYAQHVETESWALCGFAAQAKEGGA